MKLGKEEIQKIVLGVLLFFGLVYTYFNLLLGPLTKHSELTHKSAIALIPQIQNSNSQVQKAREMENDQTNATLVMRQAEALIPAGAPPWRWFPTRMLEFFKKQGVDRVTTRMTADIADKEMQGFRRVSWGIDLPKVDFATFGQAVSALENSEPLLNISAVQIDAARDDVESQHVFLTLNNLVKK